MDGLKSILNHVHFIQSQLINYETFKLTIKNRFLFVHLGLGSDEYEPTHMLKEREAA